MVYCRPLACCKRTSCAVRGWVWVVGGRTVGSACTVSTLLYVRTYYYSRSSTRSSVAFFLLAAAAARQAVVPHGARCFRRPASIGCACSDARCLGWLDMMLTINQLIKLSY